jgi:ketosteroid isomerase-like protein
MRKLLSILPLLCALVVSGPAQKNDDRDANLRSLVEAERGFARASIDRGTRAAFIENLADDATLFRPRPVKGKKWMEDHKATPGVLTWQPIFADVSSAGEMGYTTGPWEYREKSLEDQPVAHGQFVTVWKRQGDGTWKVAVDLGTANPKPSEPAPEVTSLADNRGKKKQKDSGMDGEAGRVALVKLEDDFSKHVAAKATVDAFLSYLADDVRLFRTGAFPAVGRQAARAMLAARPGLLTWQPTKAEVSRSGDLGYSYGIYESKASDGKAVESGNYLRIWKKQPDGKWKVVLDLLNPIPPAPAS